MKIIAILSFIGLIGLSLLIGLASSWGQCPEQPNDNGVCDTLYVEVYPHDAFFTNPGNLVRVLIKVTHDNPNPFDSIAGMVIPLSFTHTNPTKYCSLSSYWNKPVNWSNPRNIFRHFIANGDTIHNWMMDLYEKGNGGEWNLIDLNLDGTSNFWLAMTPFSVEDQKFGPEKKVLLATMTFKVEDTMTICIDSCFWPPSSRLKFIRSDVFAYIPRHHLPYCFSIQPWNGPRIQLTSPEKDQLNVPETVQISATFDTTMDPTTINPSTFIVNAQSSGRHPGTVSYDELTRTATFNPLQDFKVGEVVTAVLTADMLATDGTPMRQSYIWSFTVAVSRGGNSLGPGSTNPVRENPQSVFIADLDNNGDLDLAVANSGSDNVSVLLNQGDGIFAPDSVYPVGSTPYSVVAADLDGDGDLDLATSNLSSDDISVLLNQGAGNFDPQVEYPAGSQPFSVIAADLDGDGDIDLAAANAGTNDISILLNQGNATFAPQVRYPAGDYPTCICAGDLDQDGDIDLVTANNHSDQIAVLMNNGNGTFAPPSFYPAGVGPYSIWLADLDGNGNLDMAVGHGNSAASNLVSVLLNNGSGAFSLPSAYSVGNAPLSVFAADLDADGDLDLIVANAGDNTISFLSNHGNGTFSYDSDYPVGDFPIALFEADLDGNGSIDLATANRNSGNLSVLLSFIRGDANDDGIINIGDMVYLLNYLYKKGPPPSPLSSADANCDGVVDIGDAISLINYLFKSGLLPSC